MPKYIAFLRAINVGGHTVKMDHLRRFFESMGHTNVETFIASGNVIFDSRSRATRVLEQNIQDQLRANLGYGVAAFIRSLTEIREIARCRPFGAADPTADGQMVYIAFLASKPPDEATRKLRTFTNDIDEFQVDGREVYWRCQKTIGTTDFSGALLEKILGQPATIRNITTVRKLAAKYAC